MSNILTAKETLRASQIEMLQRVAADDVGWNARYRGGRDIVTYRLWSSQHEYTTVTPQIRRLYELGLVKREYPHVGRRPVGPVVLTADGHAVLKRHR